MLKRLVSLITVLLLSVSLFAALDESASRILISDIPVTYGDQSFRERILEKTEGKRDPVGLVLTGGSARALAHLGVLSYLESEGIVPDFIISNSMGSIIGLLYAAGLSPEQIIEVLTSANLSSLFSFTLPIEGGLLHPAGLETLIRGVVGKDLQLEDLDIPVMVVCEDLVTKREIRICEGDFTDVLLASFALPVYFAPREYKGHLLIDGGVISLAPVSAAFEYSDTIIVSTTFYDVSSINLRNVVTVLNSSFDIGKNQKAASDMKAHDDFIWIRCDVEQFSFMDFDKMEEMAGIGYSSAEAMADELSGIYRYGGISGSLARERRGYEGAIATVKKGLKYFDRVEAVSPSYTLGICFESDQNGDFRRYLNDAVDLAVDFDYRYFGFEAGVSAGFAFDFTTPQTTGAYPMIQGGSALVASAFFDGWLTLDWFNPDISLGYMLVADEIDFRNMGNYLDIDISSRFLLPPADSLFIDARVFSRISVDGSGHVPMFLSDGYTSPMLGKDADFTDAATSHITMLSVAFGYDVPYTPTFGEFLIIEDSEVGIYCDLLIRDTTVNVSTGVELQTAISLIGLMELPLRIRLGYDSWANSFAASFLISLKY